MNEDAWLRNARTNSEQRLADMRACGIKFVGILASPNPGEFCEAAAAMKDVKIEIEFAPPLPLPECSMRDHHRKCNCILIALPNEIINL